MLDVLTIKSAKELEKYKLEEIAALIYQSAPELFSLIFGANAISLLTRLVKGRQNRYSYRYLYLAEVEGQVLGIAIMLPAEEIHNNKDYPNILNFWQGLRLKLAFKLILNQLLRNTYPDGDFYLANLAVHPQYRGRGIGKILLQNCLLQAKKLGATSVWISVDLHNLRAGKLYQSLGFKAVQTKTMSLFGQTVGSCVLVRDLSNLDF